MTRFAVGLLIFASAFLLAACGSEPAGFRQTSALRPASAGELRTLRSKLKVSLLRTNPDSLGNARVVARVENRSGRAIPLLKLIVTRASDEKPKPAVGEAEVTELGRNQAITVSVPTSAAAGDIIVKNLEPQVTKVWLER